MANFQFDQDKACTYLGKALVTIASSILNPSCLCDFRSLIVNLNDLLTPRLAFDFCMLPYGSRVIGVADKTSDFDILIDVGCLSGTGRELDEDPVHLEIIEDALSRSPDWTVQSKIPGVLVKAKFIPLNQICK